MSDSLREALEATLCELSCIAKQLKAREGGSVDKAIKMARVALSAQQADAEAVAYRWRDTIDPSLWHTGPSYKAPTGAKIEPLYTAPPSQSAELRKALEKIKGFFRVSRAGVAGYDGDMNVGDIYHIADKALSRADKGKESEGGEDPFVHGAEDEAYALGKRDGYESAIQDIDLATGGDGEFKGSTIPGETVDVPAMKARIIARFADEGTKSEGGAPTSPDWKQDQAETTRVKPRTFVHQLVDDPNSASGKSLRDVEVQHPTPPDLYAINGPFASPLPPDRREAWPNGCRNPNSCAIHRDCMYVGCTNYDRDIGGEVDAALLREGK